MKKLMNVLLLVSMVFIISGCKEEELVEVDILVLQGKARISQFAMEANMPILGDNVDYFFEIIGSLDALEIGIENEVYDIVYAPINLGAQSYNNDGNYELAASISFGDTILYTENPEISDWDDLEDQVIYSYNPDSFENMLLEILIEAQGYETPPTIEYLDSLTDVLVKTEEPAYSIVLLEEPYLYGVISDQEPYNTISFQDEWLSLSGYNYPDYGIFVLDDVDAEIVEVYLLELQLSILELLTNVEDVIQLTGDRNLVIFPSDFKHTLANDGILLMEGSDLEDMVDEYLEMVEDYDVELIGGEVPAAAFYH